MRTSVMFAFSILMASGLTNCGSGPRGAKRAHAVQAKVTGQADLAAPTKAVQVKPIRSVSVITADVHALNDKLMNLDYDGLNDTYTVKGRIKNLYGIPAPERKEIKTILGEVKDLADEMIAAAAKLSPKESAEVSTNAEVLKSRSLHGIASMKQRDESERVMGEAMPSPDSQILIGF